MTGKPIKPYAKFLLLPQASGAWQKKIRGKIKFIGRWGAVWNSFCYGVSPALAMIRRSCVFRFTLWKQQGHKVPKKLRKRRAIGGVKRTRHRATHQDHVWAWGVSLPISDAFTPSDLTATSCHLFGIDSHAVFQDTRGRPYRVFQGDPIRALL